MARKRKRSSSFYLWTLLFGVAATGLVINAVIPDQAYSQQENRPLQQFPAPSLNGIWNGKTMEEMDRYASDQLVGRGTFQHLNYLVRKGFGQREIDDVYLGSGQLLIQSEEAAAPVGLDNMLAISTFAQQSGMPVKVLIAPNAGEVLSGKLPWLAPSFKEGEDIESVYSSAHNVQTIDATGMLNEKKDEYIFYRTDHHWTSLGAGICAGPVVGEEFSLERFDFLPVSRSFEGTLASKTGSVFLHDDIDIAVAQDHPEYLVTWNDGSKTASIYNADALYQKDQYEVFLGKNQGLVVVDTLAGNERSLLVLKDSFANSMIQFLLPYYQRITIVDPRYFYEDLDYVISSQNINEVLFLFNYNTFFSDASMQGVLQSYTPPEQPVE